MYLRLKIEIPVDQDDEYGMVRAQASLNQALARVRESLDRNERRTIIRDINGNRIGVIEWPEGERT